MSAPLSSYEKAQALQYLGYSVFETNSAEIRAFNSLDNYPLAGDFIRPILAKIEQIDDDLHAARPLALAIEDGSVKLRAHYTIDNLCKLGRIQVARLARFMKVAIFDDYFSTGRSARNAGDTTFQATDPSEPRISGMPPRLG